jgi:hypothetical protein
VPYRPRRAPLSPVSATRDSACSSSTWSRRCRAAA